MFYVKIGSLKKELMLVDKYTKIENEKKKRDKRQNSTVGPVMVTTVLLDDILYISCFILSIYILKSTH